MKAAREKNEFALDGHVVWAQVGAGREEEDDGRWRLSAGRVHAGGGGESSGGGGFRREWAGWAGGAGAGPSGGPGEEKGWPVNV